LLRTRQSYRIEALVAHTGYDISHNVADRTLYLIDGNSFCYRAYYAVRELRTSHGQPTNAVFGFVAMLNRLLSTERPAYLAAAFDLKGPTFRHEKYDQYKIHRKPMPDELVSQLPIVKELLVAYRVPIYELAGYEADDVLATIAVQAAKAELSVFIVTSDKDALQLVNDRIRVYNTHKEGLIYDADKVRERYGVGPEQMVELMALMGDATDNIPGVPGIGEKTAVELIRQFGSVETLLKRREEVAKPALRKLLEEHGEQARLSLELATIDAQVPIAVDLDQMRVQEPDVDRLAELYQRLEFRSLLKQLPVKGDGRSSSSHYQRVEDAAAFDQLLQAAQQGRRVAVAAQLTDAAPARGRVSGCALSCADGEAWFVPLADASAEPFRQRLAALWKDATMTKIGHDLKPFLRALAVDGEVLDGPFSDCMVASYLANPSRTSHALDELALEYLQQRIAPTKDEGQQTWEAVCLAADLSWRLEPLLARELEERELTALYRDVELPLTAVLAEMERVGVAINREYLGELSAYFAKELEALSAAVYQVAGTTFNINSPKQLSEILFTQLKLPIIKRTKTGASTDVEVLEYLATLHPLPERLLRYRELSKLQSTYVEALPELIDAETGRVHASFNQAVAATGRLSSSNPNLQNIPVRTEEGRKIRKAFVPGARGWTLLSADYSQIELRILAHLSGDEALIEAFQRGEDVHTHTASLIFGVKLKEVDSSMRASAKTVNFGVIYGISPYGLAKQLRVEQSVAKEFIDAYFARYPKVRSYMDEQIEHAKQHGFVMTLFHRRRYLPEIKSKDNAVRQFAERMAINTPVQGTAADLIKLAMVNLHRRLRSERCEGQMLIQVHDELVLECPKDELKPLASTVQREMVQALSLRVPIEVTLKTGLNWLEMEPVG